jgi:hypothetical protein
MQRNTDALAVLEDHQKPEVARAARQMENEAREQTFE